MIKFRYIRDENRNPVAVVCISETGWGWAVCNKKDRFSKKEGRAAAVLRMESGTEGCGFFKMYRQLSGVFLRRKILRAAMLLALQAKQVIPYYLICNAAWIDSCGEDAPIDTLMGFCSASSRVSGALEESQGT